VDVVLNPLFGEALVKSFEALAPYGRFVEIGKRDIDENSGLPMRAFNRNLTFAAVDLDRLVVERRDMAARLLKNVYEGWKSGVFKPLPVRVFSATETAEAFRYMGQARHIGKVMVNMRDMAPDHPVLPLRNPPITDEGSYLITGGFGGFGLATARWLVEQGARHLTLAGRSGAGTEEARRIVDALRQSGVSVHEARVDISDAGQTRRLIRDIQSRAPLKGVFHAAGALADGRLMEMDESAFKRTLDPKAVGAWNLHRATRSIPLDYFILYSSVSGLIGNIGQANYAAANVFLDALASYRRTRGLPAISVNWGAIREVGMAARDPALLEFLERMGLRALPPGQALAGMKQVMERNPTQIGLIDLDWPRWGQNQQTLAQSPRFRDLIATSDHEDADNRMSHILSVLGRLDETARIQTLQNLVARQVAGVLRLPLSRLDIHQPLLDMGMDSLTGFELLTIIRTALGVEISPMELMRGVSVAQLARSLHGKLTFPEVASGNGAAPCDPEEAEALLETMMPANAHD
jgi:NAD(P)-dependent dehydrogenase (short-subunit alcohol dehydrogenase family)/acyl carrier protein